MKRNLIYIYTIIVVAFFASMVSSCEVQDFDWEEARQNNPDYKYEQVFKSVFGEVAPDQSWDFSGYSSESQVATRAEGSDDHVLIGSKRYMVEDLSTDTETSIDGYKSDIDFNDIVVDFYNYADGCQEAIVRAMGGTLDFELYVGETKVFQKSAAGFNVQTMYNTGYATDKGGDGRKEDNRVLATIIVTGWNSVSNNIKFVLFPGLNDMTYNDSYFNSNYNVYEITFPDRGTKAPRIIALPVSTSWMQERQPISFLSSSPGTGDPKYTLTLSVNAGGSVNINGTGNSSGTFAYGATMPITATSNPGYRFLRWSDGNTSSTRPVEVKSDIELTAYFERIPTYTVSLSVNDSSMGSVAFGEESGSSSVSKEFYEGENVVVTAIANDGYRFVKWNDNDNAQTRTISSLNEHKELQAIFERLQGGSISGNAGDVIYGEPTNVIGTDITNLFTQGTFNHNNWQKSAVVATINGSRLPSLSAGLVYLTVTYSFNSDHTDIQNPALYIYKNANANNSGGDVVVCAERNDNIREQVVQGSGIQFTRDITFIFDSSILSGYQHMAIWSNYSNGTITKVVISQ